MISGIAQRIRRRARARPGEQPRLHPCPSIAALAVIAAALLVVGPECASGEPFDISTGLGISIPRAIKVKVASPFNPNPRYMEGKQSVAAAEPAGSTEFTESIEAAEIEVATNDPRWGLAVRFTLPKGGEMELRDAVARCRLLTPDGKIVSEQLIDANEVFLDGNGRCGEHTLFLEISGHAEALGIETLTESAVEIDGWSSSERK